jgi:hypothetical protein
MKPAPTLADSIMREWSKPYYRDIDPNNWLANNIAQARKFVMDESMSSFMADLAYASMITSSSAAKAHLLLNSMRTLSRLPFPSTWIEYDMAAKRQRAKLYSEQVIIDPEQTPDRAGWLLMQHPTLETAFLCVECASHSWSPDHVKVDRPQSIHFAYAWRSDNGPPPWPKHPTLSKAQPSVLPGGGMIMVEPEGILTGIPSYESESISVVAAPHLSPAWMAKYMIDKRQTFHPLAELSSDARYLWSLLATINSLPTVRTEVKSDRGYFDRRGRYRKFCQHTVISLTVPTKRYRRLALQAIAVARRPAHQVRAHLRIDWRNPPAALCEHIWESVPDTHMVKCIYCGGRKMAIPVHMRGDASLGHVLHDFTVSHDPNMPS